MLIKNGNKGVAEASDTLLVDMISLGKQVLVFKDVEGRIHTIDPSGVCHSGGAELAMDIIANCFASSQGGTAMGFSSEVRRMMKTPKDSGPISGELIATRMMEICGCRGRNDCDCISVENRARRELWFEHNTAQRSQTNATSIA